MSTTGPIANVGREASQPKTGINEVAPAPPADFKYWQSRILGSTIVGYALYYLVRKNLSVAMPAMEETLGIGKSQLGLFLTLHGLLYGVSKFANGMLGDRANARWFMAIGLACCAILNLLFGMSTTVGAFGIFWMLNGWFQGMGFPPCARLMTHWFPPRRFASMMAIWNSSHSLGVIAAAVMCGYLVVIDWRLCFFVPAAIALAGATWLAIRLRDTPESLGMPPVEGTENATQDCEPMSATFGRHMWGNPYIWLLAFANFFVYIVRFGLLDWGPTFLKQSRGIDLVTAGWLIAAFELSGLVGMLTGGWVTDHVFQGRATRGCLAYMIGATLVMWAFWMLPTSSWYGNLLLLCLAGFFIYGPQSLVGTGAASLATKRAAASAVGLTGFFGYLSTGVTGVGLAWLVQSYGWDAGFLLFVFSGLAGILLFACCWPAKANGYE